MEMKKCITTEEEIKLPQETKNLSTNFMTLLAAKVSFFITTSRTHTHTHIKIMEKAREHTDLSKLNWLVKTSLTAKGASKTWSSRE